MKQDNQIVKVLEWIVDTLSRSLVIIFDGVKNAVDHANPSFFGLVATLLPFVLPLPVAIMTAHSAQRFFEWEPWAANVLGFGLEGLGLLAYVRLVDFVLEHVRSGNKRIGSIIWLYGAVCFTYEVVLIFINVILANQEGMSVDYIIVLTAICLLPALSALLYGAHREAVEKQLAMERNEAKELAEKIRQEKRADRKEARSIQMQAYAADAAGVELESAQGGKFRRKK
jgi:hypothetical protein